MKLVLTFIFQVVLTSGICLKIENAFYLSNVYDILLKIEEISHLLESANVFVMDIRETKLDGSVLNSNLVIEGYDLVRLDRSRKGLF